MIILTVKTKIMAFSGKYPVPSKIIVNITLLVIKHVNSFKYLGYNLPYDHDEDTVFKITKL